MKKFSNNPYKEITKNIKGIIKMRCPEIPGSKTNLIATDIAIMLDLNNLNNTPPRPLAIPWHKAALVLAGGRLKNKGVKGYAR